MRKILLALGLVLFLGGAHAASLPVTPVTSYSHPPKAHLRFKKERVGTMGFVYAAVLGPVGYFGVKLFSRHNEVMKYHAARGFRAWGLVVGSCVVLAGCALLNINSDSTGNILAALWTP